MAETKKAAKSREWTALTNPDGGSTVPVAMRGDQPKGAPSFGMCQGTKDELERTGTAVDPFTGKTLTNE